MVRPWAPPGERTASPGGAPRRAGQNAPPRLTATASAPLGTGHAQDEQQDDGTDDGADDAGGVERVDRNRVVLDQVFHEAADEGTDDTQDDRAQDADGVATGNEQARDQARDEPDDDENDNEGDHGPLIPPSEADMRRLYWV